MVRLVVIVVGAFLFYKWFLEPSDIIPTTYRFRPMNGPNA